MRAWVAGLAVVAAIVAMADPGGAYALLVYNWGAGSTVTMHMQRGASTISLIDGSTTWN